MPNKHGWRRSSVKPKKFVKRPGLDWLVEVLIIPEDEVYPVMIFGAKDRAEAERDALSSFTFRTPDELRVIKIGLLPSET